MILSKICDLRFLLRSFIDLAAFVIHRCQVKFDRSEDENNFGRWGSNFGMIFLGANGLSVCFLVACCIPRHPKHEDTEGKVNMCC